MAIGDVSASGGLASQPVNSNAANMLSAGARSLDSSVQDLSKSIFGYLGSQTDIDRIYRNRAMASKNLELSTSFLAYQEEQARAFTERTRTASASPVGMTSAYSAELEGTDKKFLETVPAEFREEYDNKLKQARLQRVWSMFRSELELMDAADKVSLTQGLNTLGSNVKGRALSLEDAEAEWADLVEKSALPSADKEEMKRNGAATLQGLEFGTLAEEAKRGYGVANPDASGADVVAAGLLPQERALLNTISAGESPGYDIWNGGDRFTGYDDHPAATTRAPGASTAAGRYQFLLSTWRAAAASYERATGDRVPNFSPEWQDRVALHWAEVQFNRRNKEGLTFRQVIGSGNPQLLVKLRGALGNPFDPKNPASVEWEGLGDKHMSDEKFLSLMMGQKGISGGGTGAAGLPNIWLDERFAGISLEDKLRFGNAAWDANAADQTRKAALVTQQRKEFSDAVYAAAYASGDLEAMGTFRQSPYWDAETEKRYRQGVDDYRRKESSVADVSGRLAAGEILTQRDQESFARWFGDESFRGLENGDATAWSKLGYAAQQAKLLPKGSVEAARVAISNPQTMPVALEMLASLNAGDPTILRRSGFAASDLTQVELFGRIAGRTSPGDAVAHMSQMLQRQQMPGYDAGKERTAAGKLYAENIGFSTVTDIFEDWVPFNSPKVEQTSSVGVALESDAITAFQDGYAIFGTEEAAKVYMEKALKMSWGATWNGGVKTLMKYPPEITFGLNVPQLDELIRGSVQLFGEDTSEIDVPENGFSLVADRETELAVRRGETPTYLVRGTTASGETFLLENRWGGEEGKNGVISASKAMFEADITQARVRAAEEAAEAARIRADEARRTNRPDLERWEREERETASRATGEKIGAGEKEQLGFMDQYVYRLFQKLQRQITGNLAGQAMK